MRGGNRAVDTPAGSRPVTKGGWKATGVVANAHPERDTAVASDKSIPPKTRFTTSELHPEVGT